MESLAACLLCGSTERRAHVAVIERLVGTGETFTVVRCGGCGLFRTDPRPTRAALRRYYPEHYAPYQPGDGGPAPWLGAGAKGLLRRWTLSAHYRYSFVPLRGVGGVCVRALTLLVRNRYVQVPPFVADGRLLEVGCATGERLAMLRSLGWSVAGVEISLPACRLARERYGLDVFCGELADAQLPAASVDAVIMSHVLEHVHDPVATLGEVRRILRPGGTVVIETPNAASLERWIFRGVWYDWEIPRHLFVFDACTLGACCVRSGLRVTRVVYSSFTGDWIRSVAYWCSDRGWTRIAAWLGRRPSALMRVLAPLGKLLAWARTTGRMTVVAARD